VASVNSKTSAEIDDLLRSMVVSAEITAEGQLLLTTKGGTVVNVGPVGASSSQIEQIVDDKTANLSEQIDDAQALAASKAETTIANTPPTSPAAGDLWYDTSTTPPSAKMWDGDSWEAADAAAQSLANTAKQLASNKAVVTVGPNIPASAALGDIWYDTALSPTKTFVCKLAYSSGGSLGVNFSPVEDPVAQATANSKATGTVGATAPTNPQKGDSWTDTALTPNATFTWSGSQWIADDATAQAIAQTKASSKSGSVAPTNPLIGDLWYDTSGTTPQAKIWNGTTWAIVDAGAAASAQLAYTLASTRVKATVASVAPSGAAKGDLWFDTSTTPTAAKVFDGSAWVPADAAAQAIANQTQTLLEQKATVTVDSVAPTSPDTGDLWYDTSTTPAAAKIWNGSAWAQADSSAQAAAASASGLASQANTLAGGKAKITVSNTAPSTKATGDIWYDTATTPASAQVWNGTAWVAADSAAKDIATQAGTLAGSKAKATVSNTAPTGPSVGDLWYDTTSTPAAAKIWNGSSWAAADAAAQNAAGLASTLAGTKAKVTVASTAPTSPAAGDMWVDTSTTPAPVKTWSGSAWIAVDAVSQSIAQGKSTVSTSSTMPTKASLNDVWNDTSVTPQVTRICTAAYTSNGTVASNWAKVVSDAVAQTIANGKNKTTVGNAAPSSPATGDMWVDITLSPAGVKTWNGTAWVLGGDATAQATATAAQTAANAKATVVVSSTQPTTHATGDLWYDTSTTPAAAKVWNGSAYVAADASAQSAAAAASTLAGQANTLAGTKADVTIGSTAPATKQTGDVWYDTSTTPNAAKTWNGMTWVALDSAAAKAASDAAATASTAITNASSALTAANAKATIVVSGTQPGTHATGDLWYDTSTTPAAAKVWNGTTYVAADSSAQAAAASASTAASAASTLAGTKADVTISSSVPATASVGDVWYDTAVTPTITYICKTAYSSGGTTSNYYQVADPVAQSNASTAITNASNALTAANAKATVVVSSTQPSTHASGDIWYDTSTTPAAAKVWNGTAYVAADSAAQNAASQASTAASNASTLAGSKADITISSTAPTTKATGDVWYDTSVTPNAAKTWNGTTWIALDAAAIKAAGDANTAAGNASTLAGTKAKVTVNNTAPSAPATGDIWYNTSTTPATVESWNGSSWIVSGDTTARASANSKATITIGPSAPSTKQTGDLWYDTSITPNAIKTWNGSAWVSADSAALASAGIKGRIYSQPTAPSPVDMNGLWIDTDAGNKVYHGSRRAIYYGFTRTGSNIPGRLTNLGWEVTQVDTMPTVDQAKGYDLLVLDAQVWSASGDYQAFFNAGLNIFTSGNDTTHINGMFTTTITSDYTTTPTHPYPGSSHPVAQGWNPYTDNDNVRYLGGLDASASIVGSNLIGTTEQPMIVVKEGSLGQRWIHCQTASSYTPIDVMTAMFTWLTTWVPSQDAGISAAQTTASAAQGVANNTQTRLNQLVTGDLTVEGVLNVNLQVAKSLILNKGSGAKNSIIIDPDLGIQINDPTGSTFIELPTDPSKSASFNGDVTATSITAEKTTFHGTENEVVPAASLTLSNAVSPPKNSPIAASTPYTNITVPGFTYPTAPSGSSLLSYGGYQPRDTAPLYGALIIGIDNNLNTTYRATVYSPNVLTTAATVSTTLPANVLSVLNTSGFSWIHSQDIGFVMIGTTCFLKVSTTIYKWTHGSSTAATVFNLGAYNWTLGTDGTNLYVVGGTNYAAMPNFYSVNQSTGALTLIGALPSAAGSAWWDPMTQGDNSIGQGPEENAIYIGTFDRGVKQLILVADDGTSYYMNASTLADTSSSNPSDIPGTLWDPSGARFYNYVPTAGASAKLATKFSKNKDVTPVWVAYTWRNPNNGDHETTLGPPVQVSVSPYWGISVTRPTPPTAGTAGDVPQTARIYAARGTTQPASSAFRMFLEDNDTATNMISFDLTFGTTAPPTTGEFPTGTPGLLESEAGGFVVRGDGTGAWPGLVPIGSMQMFLGTTDPAGWMICDGRYLSRTQYADLYAVLKPAIDAGYIGQGDGSTTFNLPDMSGRVGVGLDPDGEAASVTHIGERGGEETHLLTANESGLRSHNHSASSSASTSVSGTNNFVRYVGTGGGGNANLTFGGSNNLIGQVLSVGVSVSTSVGAVAAANAATAHNNMQPYMGVNYIIKY